MKTWLFSLTFIFSFSVSATDPTEKQNIAPENKVAKSHVKTAFLEDMPFGSSIVLAAGAGAVLAGFVTNESSLVLAGGGVIVLGGGIKWCHRLFRKE